MIGLITAPPKNNTQIKTVLAKRTHRIGFFRLTTCSTPDISPKITNLQVRTSYYLVYEAKSYINTNDRAKICRPNVIYSEDNEFLIRANVAFRTL